jgi:hypothetical protein
LLDFAAEGLELGSSSSTSSSPSASPEINKKKKELDVSYQILVWRLVHDPLTGTGGAGTAREPVPVALGSGCAGSR